MPDTPPNGLRTVVNCLVDCLIETLKPKTWQGWFRWIVVIVSIWFTVLCGLCVALSPKEKVREVQLTPTLTSTQAETETETETETPISSPEPTSTMTPEATIEPTLVPVVCPKKVCGDFTTCTQVHEFLSTCNWYWGNFDRDGDGIPCESLCG